MAVGMTLAVVVAGIGLRRSVAPSGAGSGAPAPQFRLPLIAGEGATGERAGPDVGGKRALLLHFWAPSCAPCIQELPLWQRLHEAARSPTSPFAVLTVAGDEADDVARFLAANAYTFRVVHDALGAAHRAYRVQGIPHTVVIDSEGRLGEAWSGARPEAEVRAAVARAGVVAR